MSQTRVIGGVGETLRALLADRIEGVGPDAPVVVRLDAPSHALLRGAARLHLWLYDVRESAAARMGRTAHPPARTNTLDLELHYLLVAYPTVATESLPDERAAHDLLGRAMAVFHDVPVLGRQLLRQREQPVGAPVMDPALEGRVEQLRITCSDLELDVRARLWIALQEPIRPSVSYVVNLS